MAWEGCTSVTPEGWIVLGSNPPKELVVPEMTLDWFKKNRQTLSALCEIITLVGSDEGNNEFVAMISAGVEGLEQLPELLHSLLEEGDTEALRW